MQEKQSRKKKRGTNKVFPKRATNYDDFQKDVLLRTVLEYYDKGKFPTVKKVKLGLRGKKIAYKGSFLQNGSVLFLHNLF
jgi:hypothetical protein